MPEIQHTGAPIVWPQSGGMLTASTTEKSPVTEAPALPESPAGEIERILREYASECYAVGRGESMYYLVEDLPRLAHEATQEVLAVRPRGISNRWRAGWGVQARVGADPSVDLNAPGSNFHPVLHPPKGTPVSVTENLQATARRGARAVVAVLPVLTVLAALGLTIVLAISGL